MVFESRQAEDRKDMQVIAAWRRAKRPEAMMRVDFLPAVAEPGLWLADIIAGAFMWWLRGTCDHWLMLADKCRVVEVHSPEHARSRGTDLRLVTPGFTCRPFMGAAGSTPQSHARIDLNPSTAIPRSSETYNSPRRVM